MDVQYNDPCLLSINHYNNIITGIHFFGLSYTVSISCLICVSQPLGKLYVVFSLHHLHTQVYSLKHLLAYNIIVKKYSLNICFMQHIYFLFEQFSYILGLIKQVKQKQTTLGYIYFKSMSNYENTLIAQYWLVSGTLVLYLNTFLSLYNVLKTRLYKSKISRYIVGINVYIYNDKNVNSSLPNQSNTVNTLQYSLGLCLIILDSKIVLCFCCKSSMKQFL